MDACGGWSDCLCRCSCYFGWHMWAFIEHCSCFLESLALGLARRARVRFHIRIYIRHTIKTTCIPVYRPMTKRGSETAHLTKDTERLICRRSIPFILIYVTHIPVPGRRPLSNLLHPYSSPARGSNATGYQIGRIVEERQTVETERVRPISQGESAYSPCWK
jgi:hypothetical protein